ncbi:MAG: sulfatase [Planctomycetaceae bacterium]|nr:sulfatase [Planctomycetaceae bacterium]
MANADRLTTIISCRDSQGGWLKHLAILIFVAVSLECSMSRENFARSAEVSRQPNIVLILADDLGNGDLACYGHQNFKSPRLDRLAGEGARFTQFNTPMPFCAPTRAALLTGRYPFHTGMMGNPAPDGGPVADRLGLSHDERILPEVLKSAGYATACVGKWHLGHQPEFLPTKRGFDEYFGIPYSNDMRPVKLVDGERDVEYPVIQSSLTKRYTERAKDFIRRQRDRPFFLYLPHAMPHKPLAVSEQNYHRGSASLYADTIAELDASIGELLDQLDEFKLTENTLVIFTSDNGPWYGGSSGGLRGMKGSTWEGGYRVPCIMRWPNKIPAGKSIAALAGTIDIFPTILQATGVKTTADRPIDGCDLLPLLDGRIDRVHDVLIGSNGKLPANIRDERWKLHIAPPGSGRFHDPNKPWFDPRGPDGVTIIAPFEQYQTDAHPGVTSGVASKSMMLFDLQADPSEQIDLAEKHPAIVARLRQHFEQLTLQSH